jgi:thioredoxin reductase
VKYGAVVVGGGPAGITCALWLQRLGHPCVLLEQAARLGGLLWQSPGANPWLPGFGGRNGPELAVQLERELMAAGVTVHTGCSAGAFAEGWTVQAGARAFCAPYLVLATGVRPRSGGHIASPTCLIGPGAHLDTYDFRGKRVALLGGGDNAFENYGAIQARGASEVRIYARNVRAAGRLVRAVPAEHVLCESYSGQADVVVVLYGFEAVCPLPLARDAHGFVCTDERRRTPTPGAYAIGELTRRAHPCVITAMADGVIAAKDIQERLDRG